MAKVLHFQSILERSNEPESCFYLALRMCTYVKKTLENSLYRTPNQRKPAIFTKHSNSNINTSCYDCQGSSPKTRSGVLGASQTKTWMVGAHPSRRSSVSLLERAFSYKVMTNIGMMMEIQVDFRYSMLNSVF